MGSLFIAWQYVRYHRVKTMILIASITLMVYLPAGLDALVGESARQLRRRADATPLLLGAKGSDIDLVLNSLYFESSPPARTEWSHVQRVWDSGLADAVPLYVRFRAQGHPIVGTSLDYFAFRQLRCREGRPFATLGECLVGSGVARELNLEPGDSLVSTPESVFDLAGVYPLKMHVVGVLEATGTPDDNAVFADVKTVWVIQGLGHGHQNLANQNAKDSVLARQGNQITANPAVVSFNEITKENVGSFHFHGDIQTFPITAVIGVPHDQKSKTILIGRYQSDQEEVQVVRPSFVMEELLGTVLRVRRFIVAGALLLAVATVLSVILVFVLSLRLRRRELATMARIGGSRWRIGAIVAFEILLVVVLSVSLAGGMTLVTRSLGEAAIRWFLL